MMPKTLYHGTSRPIEGELMPVLRHGSEDHVHERVAVFATERIDVAALFMIPEDALSSIGFEQDIAYICIWGKPEDFASRDRGGWIYALPGETFEKVGKSYEWQSFEPVYPAWRKRFESVVDGMVASGAQVYFIDDNGVFDRIVADKHGRAPILISLTSENAKRGHDIRTFI